MAQSLNLEECHAHAARYIEQYFIQQESNKFNNLTVEELYYVSKVLAYEPKQSVNQFMISLKANCLRWLTDSRPKPSIPWETVARFWQEEFLLFMETSHV